jgi:ATP-dependent RNA helicase DeaD
LSDSERQPEAVLALDAAIERGHHAALIASEGAGLARLYAHAALHDLADDDSDEAGELCLVLAASTERSTRIARAMQPPCAAGGLEVAVLSFEGSGAAAMEAGARVLVGTPGIVLGEVRSGRLGLGGVRTFILDDVKGLSGAWDAVEGLLQAGGEATRRIAVTREPDARFEELVDRRMPRARRWPAELFDADGDAPAGPVVAVGSAPTRSARLARLVELTHEIAAEGAVDRVTIWAADAVAADRIRAALSVEGFRVADGDGSEGGIRIRVLDPGDSAGGGAAILCGLPPDPDILVAALESAEARYAIVDTLHEAQFGILLRRRGWRKRPLGDPPEPEILDDIEHFRAGVETAIEGEDLAAATLLLAPLLETHGAGRVAAALAAMVRAADRAPAPGQTVTAPAERAARPVWTRLFIGVGGRDGARPGDLVGAIVGETGTAAAQIGKIDIRPNFALVDVDSQVADQIIRGLSGKRIKGRDVVARRDRAKS